MTKSKMDLKSNPCLLSSLESPLHLSKVCHFYSLQHDPADRSPKGTSVYNKSHLKDLELQVPYMHKARGSPCSIKAQKR